MIRPSIPAWFEEALEREFQGRLRIRWSQQRNEWHIEEKVGRGVFDAPKNGKDSDRWMRARDGYRFFAAVQPGTKRACPECRIAMNVPECEFREVQCDYCGFRGLSGRLVLAHFPLGEKLLQHLRKHDPTRDRITKNIKEIDLHNERLQLGMDRANEFERQEGLREWAYSQFPVAGLPAKQKDAPWN